MKKFLIILLYSNGDCLYATPIARQLKLEFPGCKVTWAISPFCSAILSNNPYIDEIWKIDYINDKSIKTYKQNIGKLFEQARERLFDEIIFPQIVGDNFVRFNGQIRLPILKGYPRKITVPIQPILELFDEEKKHVEDFLVWNKIDKNDFLILYEFAPQSGQSSINWEKVISLSNALIKFDEQKIKVVLSSAQKINSSNQSIIDGSTLTLRETSYLTRFCTLLIGSSSGITWASTSTAGKRLPSIQILDNKAYMYNSPILDAQKNNLPTDNWLEINEFNEDKIVLIVKTILTEGFDAAKNKYGTVPIQTFRLYRGIIHHFLEELKFKQIHQFIRNNYKEYGLNLSMFKNIFLGFVLFPIQFLLDKKSN